MGPSLATIIDNSRNLKSWIKVALTHDFSYLDQPDNVDS